MGFEMDGVRHQHTWLRGIGFCQRKKEGIPPCRKGHAFPWGVLTLGSGQLATLRLQRPQAA